MRLQTRAFLIATGVGFFLQFSLLGLQWAGAWGLSQTLGLSTADLVFALSALGGAVQCCGWLLDALTGAAYPLASAPTLQVSPEAGALGGASAAGLSRLIQGLVRLLLSGLMLFTQPGLSEPAMLPAFLIGQITALAVGLFTLLFSLVIAAISGSVVASFRLRQTGPAA